MTRAEEALLELPLQTYLIQGERNEGEDRPPPVAPIRAATESRAVDEYMRRYGRRPVNTLVRARSFKLRPPPPLPGLTPAAGTVIR